MKNAASPRAMTLQRAEQLVQHLQDLIADESKRGARRSPSLLPTPKPELLGAIKLAIAQLYMIGADDERRIAPLLRAAMVLDTFSDVPVGATEFVSAMVDRREEIEGFRQKLRSISKSDPFFWQQVDLLAGVELQTPNDTLFQRLQRRLRGRPNISSPSDPVPKSAYDYASGRYDLDAP